VLVSLEVPNFDPGLDELLAILLGLSWLVDLVRPPVLLLTLVAAPCCSPPTKACYYLLKAETDW